MRLVVLSMLLCACGRIGFDASSDGGVMTPDARPLPAGIVAWLPFDDDPSDGADVFGPDYGPGATAACVGPCPVAAPGIVAGAATFAGGPVSLPDSAALRLGNGSITAWINPTTLPAGSGSESIVGRPYGGMVSDSYELLIGSAPSLQAGGDSDTGGPYVFGNYPAAPGTWIHVAFTWDDSAERLYANGVEVVNDVPFTKLYDAHDVYVGGDIDDGTMAAFFDGSLDDVRIYNRALTAAEVLALATR
ncbi:MAG TPA: LamG domain-containing protein [Kofleriaceae bacterium]|jgi:hypothetical protein